MPTIFVEICHIQCRQLEVIGDESKQNIFFYVPINYHSYWNWIEFCRLNSRQYNSLVAANSCPLVNIIVCFDNPASEEVLDVEGGLAILGYCGLRSEKLISSVKRTNGDGVDITYTLDKDGFVTKIVYTYTDRGDITTSTYEIEYY